MPGTTARQRITSPEVAMRPGGRGDQGRAPEGGMVGSATTGRSRTTGVAEVLSKTRRNTNGLALRFVALTACRAVSGRSGGCSGHLRALGSPRIDDLRSPRGMGRGESVRGRARRRHRKRWSAAGRSLPFVWLAAKGPGRLPATARPRLFRAVPERRFGGVRWGWLTIVSGGPAYRSDHRPCRAPAPARSARLCGRSTAQAFPATPVVQIKQGSA